MTPESVMVIIAEKMGGFEPMPLRLVETGGSDICYLWNLGLIEFSELVPLAGKPYNRISLGKLL